MGKICRTNFESIGKYELIARSFLGKRHRALRDNPDAINTAISGLMDADRTWDGRGTLYGYRSRVMSRMVGRYIGRTRGAKLKPVALEELEEVKRDEFEVFEAAKEKLEAHEYELIDMKFKQNMKYGEIAEHFGLTKQTVQEKIQRILKILKSRLDQEDFYV